MPPPPHTFASSSALLHLCNAARHNQTVYGYTVQCEQTGSLLVPRPWVRVMIYGSTYKALIHEVGSWQILLATSWDAIYFQKRGLKMRVDDVAGNRSGRCCNARHNIGTPVNQ